MKPTARREKALLLATARVIAAQLKQASKGTRIRVRQPARAGWTNTNGWRAVVGDLGKNQPRLEVWLDSFTGHQQRKFYLCFCHRDRDHLHRLANGVARKLRPHRHITDKDTDDGKFLRLAESLRRVEFGLPFLESYSSGDSFYGIYDFSVRSGGTSINPHLCARGVAFFADVARTLPNARPEETDHEVYPQVENRRLVAAHLQRERSGLLATECKIRDKYQCQICGLRFERVYGEVGKCFAEAHHLVPLSRLGNRAKTSLEDLVTVCANCHRMLHRMEGRRDDVRRLKLVVKKHRMHR
jgi:5-methylcytosine-specific restriction endonuclease McrA